MKEEIEFSTLAGKTLKTIVVDADEAEIDFETAEGEKFRLYHEPDCCEYVRVEEIIGDLADLVGVPLLQAEEAYNSGDTSEGSQTWTFYKLATIKGSVTLRWLGESNGYYSEDVSFIQVT